jgi:peptide/nickel transport system substrate-binding protein
MRSSRGAAWAVSLALLAVGLSACGSSNSSNTGSNSSPPGGSTQPGALPLKAGENPTVGQVLYGKKKGGTLNVYSSEGFLHLDPGAAYFVEDYSVVYVTQRPLFVYAPNSSSEEVPDLATAIPTVANGGITNGGKTITVHIQPDVHFSPPTNRLVTSADVENALDRGANPNVGNGYWPIYFKYLVGFSKAKGGPFPGITTPNSTTIQFHLTQPADALLIGALSLPLSAPVPASMSGPDDKHGPTTYGATSEASTGPYMIQENEKTGQMAGVGYQAGKSLTLVRNPNWNANSYTSAYKPPAYLNKIVVNIGEDATVIGLQVLKGSDSVQLDTPAQSIVQTAYQQYPSQITFTPGAGTHYAGLNTQAGPFKNVWLRRAAWAALNREAIVKARGGPLVAAPMTHFIYPTNAGYTEAGGAAGPNYPWNTNIDGNMAEATALMKKAGYPSGKYTGNQTLQVVSGNNSNAPAIAQIIDQALNNLGFKTHLSEVDQSAMYGKYCGVPKAEIDVCPSSGWVRDFDNPLTVLYVPFSGQAIVPVNNSNWSQLNNPTINSEMNRAALISDPTAAANAWAKIDNQLVNQAAGLPETFDSQANIRAKDVNGVNDLWNVGSWDFAFTSLDNP